mmetsp:Transcript_8905/g.32628  ORF Transcript_8905/g.32628 Transcript_8905/m.32628 type:complete len:214 (+) Transcript_8905:2512-3153(+)
MLLVLRPRGDLAQAVRRDDEVETRPRAQRPQRRDGAHRPGQPPRVRVRQRAVVLRLHRTVHQIPEIHAHLLVVHALRDPSRERHHARRRVHERRVPSLVDVPENVPEHPPRGPQRGRGAGAELEHRLRIKPRRADRELLERSLVRAERHRQARHRVRGGFERAVRERRLGGRRGFLLLSFLRPRDVEAAHAFPESPLFAHGESGAPLHALAEL